MKNFDALLFLGNGIVSEQGVEKLKRVLEQAIEISSGNQQGPSDPRARFAIEEAVRDIAVALTGRSIEFKDRVSYPGVKNRAEFETYYEDGIWSKG